MNFGIICEFNPFHEGHAYLFGEARRLGAKNIACAMSGNAVQRGELAIIDKYSRAAVALKRGANLVLELPFPWSSASAEYFAMAGVKALSSYCDALIFGSECGDIEVLKKAAQSALTSEFCDKYEERKKKGEGAAAAYFELLKDVSGVEFSSNDVLGIEYIKAAMRLGSRLEFYTVKRIGNAYRDDNIHEGQAPSASAIRKEIIAKNSEMISILENDIGSSLDGELTDISLVEKAILLHFRLSDARELSRYAEADGGVAERICSAARESADIEGFWSLLCTKRYTDAKLARAVLFCMTRVERELLSKDPEYLYLLAADKSGRELLTSVRKSGGTMIPIVTKPADAPRGGEQFAVEERLNSLFSLARENAYSVGDSYKKNAFIIK